MKLCVFLAKDVCERNRVVIKESEIICESRAYMIQRELDVNEKVLS